MDYSQQPTTPGAALPSMRRRQLLITTLLLVIIVAIGAYFRTVNLSDWDGQTGQHPDERFMHYTVFGMEVPNDFRTYLTSSCANPVPMPRNPQDKPEDWSPSLDSGCSTLNPRNFTWSRSYVYGTFPTTLTRLVAEATDRTGVSEILLVGRSLSVISDLITLLATFFLAYTLYGRRAALLAAALYAGAVMPIQQSHFFTVDNFAVAFGTLALLFAVRLGQRGRWSDAILTGLSIGAAVASKINMAALVALVGVALLQLLWSRYQRPDDDPLAAIDPPPLVNQLVRLSLLLFVTGVVTFLAFRIFQPDAFTGPNLWNIGLEPRFRTRLDEARLTANGTIDLPSSHQWAARTPWLFPWQNMVLWGLGAPLGLVGWIAWAAAGWQMLTRRRFVHLVPWIWIALYFGWQGQQFVTTMRYFLPLYAPLCAFAAWGLVRLYELAARRRRARVYPLRPSIVYRWTSRINRFKRPVFALGLVACVLGTTWAWAWAYTRIYTRPYTRVTAAEWIERAEPDGTTTTWEWWDDLLPFPSGDKYQQKTTYPYAEDELEKYTGKFDNVNPGDDAAIGLIEQLSRSEYVVLTSPRVYGSIVRVPQRFPATARYYQALFDGSLGFQLVADVRSFPTLLGIPIPDLGAEEAFWVYDHPRVLIFRRTAEFSPDRARLLLTQGMNWDEVYRGLRPEQVNKAPTALQLTPSAWNKLQAIDTRYLFAPQSGLVGLLIWLLAIEVLGAAMIGLLWRLRLPLPDRGLSLARPIGLLLFASLPSLLGALQILSLSRWLLLAWFAALVIGGGWQMWKSRREINTFIQARRSGLIVGQALYSLTLIAGVLLYRLGLGVAPSETVARWTALVRTATLPPYDPFFAGGHDPLPYTARLPFALLNKLLGLYPETTLRYVIPTALALALLGVWSALYNSFVPRADRRAQSSSGQMQSGLLAVLGALLVVIPGVVLNNMTRLSLWQALADWNAESVGLAALVATTIALGVGLLRPTSRDPLRNLVLLLLVPLVLLRGQNGWIFGAIFGVVALLAGAGARGDLRRWSRACLTLLVGAVGLGHLFAWSLAAPLVQASEATITPLALLLGLILPLALLFWVIRRSGSQVADRAMLLMMAGFVMVWIAVATLLNWSVAMPIAPLLMLLTWLAVQAWLPGFGARRWRLGALLGTAAIALLLLLIGSLMQSGRIAGDATQLVIIATLLLAVAAGWSLPQLGLPEESSIQSNVSRLIGSGIAAQMIMILVIGGLAIGQLRAQAPPTERTTTSELSAALRWLAQQTPGTPIVATASQSTTASAASTTGLPTLLTSIDEERRVRDMLQPSISGVIDGRQRAIDDLYGGGVERARQIITNYKINYVLVGPEERERFGENAGIALEVLAGNKSLKLAYDQGGVQIYSATPNTDLPQFVAQKTTLKTPASKTLMLDRPVDELPVIDEYGWNTLASNVQPLGVVLWLLLLEVLGLLAFPLVALIFRSWHDRGWGVSKIAGLVIWGYAVWLPVNLRWWNFNWWSLVFSALVLALLSAAAYVRQIGGWSRLRAGAVGAIFPARTVLLRSEICFLIAFGIWTLVRAANPDVWHPYFGGEKPFEFGFLNAILRSPVLPPYDPFFSDGIINYYYYGLFLVGLPIKAIGIDPAIGFNLAIATLFAFTATAALALGRQITGRWRYGLFAILLLVGVGPFASAFKVQESQGLAPIFAALSEGISGFGGRLGSWFWGPSRVIPNTINEFPLFGFLFADLHPHLIALPITLLAMACAVEVVQRRPRAGDRTGYGALLALSALVIGALAIANSWDAPTYALVIGGALVGQSWRSGLPRGVSLLRLGRVARAIVVALAVTAVGLALYTPFFLHYQAMVGGVGRVRSGDTIAEYILLYAPMLFVGLTLLGCVVWLAAQRATAAWRVAARGTAITLPLLIAGLLLSGWALQNQPVFAAGWPLRTLLGVLALTGILLALVARLRDKEWLPLWLITVGCMVALGIQFIFIKDHLAGGDAQRMNTVFKFGQQIWALWAIGAATAMPLILRRLRRFELATGIWYGMLIVLLLPGLLYPLVALPSRLSTRFNTDDGLTLDGLKFMQRAKYTVDDHEIDLRFDGEAIAWIKQNIAGTPVFASSEAEFYRVYGMRIAANTGVPTVLGRLHQDEQRPGVLVQERNTDVHTLFSTPDPVIALPILAKYHVDYVYVGPIERLLYSEPGAAKWEQMQGQSLDLVFRNDGVQIYKVKAETIADVPVETQPEPPAVFDDPALRALEAEVASKPQDSAAAFGLGQRYAQVGRLKDAARVLSNAAQSNPNDVPLHHLLGDIQSQLGNADEAVAAWQHAAEVQRTPENLNKLAQGLIQFGRWQEAEQALNEALQINPNFIDAHFYLGELYRTRADSGDPQRAIEAYQRYLAAAPTDAPWRALAEEHLSELQ